MNLQIELDGWELDIEVTHYQPAVAGYYSGLPENCFPDEAAEVEFEVVGYESLCAPEDHCTSEEVQDSDELEGLVLAEIESIFS